MPQNKYGTVFLSAESQPELGNDQNQLCRKEQPDQNEDLPVLNQGGEEAVNAFVLKIDTVSRSDEYGHRSTVIEENVGRSKGTALRYRGLDVFDIVACIHGKTDLCNRIFHFR